MKVLLEIVAGPDKGRTFEFSEPDMFLIGRSRDAHLSLSNADLYVSRRHCLLEIVPPRCFLHHISNTNPTIVNGKEVDRKELKGKDRITIGYTTLQVRIMEYAGSDGIENEAREPKSAPEDGEEKEASSKVSLFSSADDEAVITATEPCSKCGVDLSEQANMDGRAKLLRGRATYLCPECLPRPQFMKGEKIGLYELIRFIGGGGMGTVYQVYDRRSARLLILKRIGKLAKKEVLRRHFLREIEVHRNLEHPYIIQYVDSGMHNTDPYLVMEYADGGNLEELLLKRQTPLELAEAIPLITRSLEALVYFHQKEPPVVHRDIKPGNILLRRTSGGLIPKITDFGLAKPFATAGGSALTKIGDRKGSLLFMSPEQILNTRDVDGRTDIYAMGLTFYYLISGKLPYPYPSSFELKQVKAKYKGDQEKIREKLKALGYGKNILNIILGTPAIPIENRRPDVPGQLASVINKAIEKDKNKRYAHAEEFLQDLRSFS